MLISSKNIGRAYSFSLFVLLVGYFCDCRLILPGITVLFCAELAELVNFIYFMKNYIKKNG